MGIVASTDLGISRHGRKSCAACRVENVQPLHLAYLIGLLQVEEPLEMSCFFRCHLRMEKGGRSCGGDGSTEEANL